MKCEKCDKEMVSQYSVITYTDEGFSCVNCGFYIVKGFLDEEELINLRENHEDLIKEEVVYNG